MSETTKTVFITKYAMTDGILEKPLIREQDGMATVGWRNGLNEKNSFFGKDWHHTREAALARADEMRLAKIASHERSIAKLRKMRFIPAPTREGE